MNLDEAKQYLREHGFFLDEIEVEVEPEQNKQDKDIYDIQDYVLHHAKYKGLAGMQMLMDWLSFDNPDANSFMGWIKTNYQPGCDVLELQDQAVLAADEYLSHCQNIPSQEVFYDEDIVYQNMMGEASEEYITRASEEALKGNISTWDRAKINKGQKPSWVKSLTDIGPRKRPLRQSSSHSEIAMRRVTNPKEEKPYTSADWKADKEANKIANTKILQALEVLVPVDLVSKSVTDNNITLNFGKYIFRITPRGPRYFVVRINVDSVMDRKSDTFKTVKDVADYIKNNV